MEPGTLFVLENAGQVGEKEDPYWAVLSCPSLRNSGADHAQADRRIAAGDLRVRPVLSAVLHPRQ